mmetsp:Transcript_12837/g.38238  ORF Transcript_12837/g.38238 Transcript_12837/m.38238 type:complete len:600 (-) Transcript_12837:1295-3094(-)
MASVVLALEHVHRVAIEPCVKGVGFDRIERRILQLLRVPLPVRVQEAPVREDPQPGAAEEGRRHEGELLLHGRARGQLPGAQAPRAPRRGDDRERDAPEEVHRRVQAVGSVVARLAEAQVLIAAEAIVEASPQEHHQERVPHVVRHEEQHREADRGVHDRRRVVPADADLHRLEAALGPAERVPLERLGRPRQEHLQSVQHGIGQATPDVNGFHEDGVPDERDHTSHDDTHHVADEECARHKRLVDVRRERVLHADGDQRLNGQQCRQAKLPFVLLREHHQRGGAKVEECVHHDEARVGANDHRVHAGLAVKAQAIGREEDLQADKHVHISQDHARDLHLRTIRRAAGDRVRPHDVVGERHHDQDLDRRDDRQDLERRPRDPRVPLAWGDGQVPPIHGRRLGEDLVHLDRRTRRRNVLQELLRARARPPGGVAVADALEHGEEFPGGRQLLGRGGVEPRRGLLSVLGDLLAHGGRVARARVLHADAAARQRRAAGSLDLLVEVDVHALDEPVAHGVDFPLHRGVVVAHADADELRARLLANARVGLRRLVERLLELVGQRVLINELRLQPRHPQGEVGHRPVIRVVLPGALELHLAMQQ